MFGPPHHKSLQQPPVRVMQQTTQTMLDMLRRKAKPKIDAPSTTQPEKSDSPSSARTTASRDTSSVRDATKKLPRIRTLAEARACLLDAQLIEPDDPLAPDTLAGMLAQISLFPGLSQVARDAIRLVALLLVQMKPANGREATADGLVGRMMDMFTEAVKAVTQAAISEVKSASSTLTESSTQIAATCYDSIRLGLGPAPEPCPARSDPPGVSAQLRHVT